MRRDTGVVVPARSGGRGMGFRDRIGIGTLVCAAALAAVEACAGDAVAPPAAIGYTEHATALPGGRLANVSTGRAMLLEPGRPPVPIVAGLADAPDSWTQFAGWFPDGKTAIVGRGWESRENAALEEGRKEFLFRDGHWLHDIFLVDLASGRATNVTAVERVSFHNSGLFPWPGDPDRLGFTALVGGVSKPFAMDRDGRNKTDLARDSAGFSYGFSGSPDGGRVAYHENYRLLLADADGSNRRQVDTGHPFDFAPTWSPDGRFVLFLSGEHHDCHPHVVRADCTGVRKLADRRGYRGVTEFLDVPDFHGGSSDVPVWAHDGAKVFFTARVAGEVDGGEETVELFEVGLGEGSEPVRLTTSAPGTTHYHPRPSPDGGWLLYGSRRAVPGGMARNLFARRLADGVEVALTRLPAGLAAMHGHWQPAAAAAGPALAARPVHRRLLSNLDGDSCLATRAGVKGPAAVGASDVRRLVEEVAFAGSRVDTVAVCVAAQVTYYPTSVGTMRGDDSTAGERAAWPPSERQRHANVAALFAAGVDPYALMLAETRARGREAWISFRMNDDRGDDFLRTRFRAEHPEWTIGGERSAGRDALDFGRDEVCEHVFRLVEEAATRYDADGVELDFNRFPRFFRDDLPGEDRVRRMTASVWRVRGVLDRLSVERGRRVVLAVRVPSNGGRTPPTPHSARTVGCDVPAWVAAGLVDHVTVSGFLPDRGDLPVEEWIGALPGVSLAFGIECSTGAGQGNLSAEEYHAAAAKLLGRGARGVSLLDCFTTRERGEEAVEPPFGVLGDLVPAE